MMNNLGVVYLCGFVDIDVVVVVFILDSTQCKCYRTHFRNREKRKNRKTRLTPTRMADSRSFADGLDSIGFPRFLKYMMD